MPGLLDFLNNAGNSISTGLDNAAGLLQSDPTVQLGLGLLQAGGPSRTPVSFGQGLAHASQFASERQQQQQLLDMRRQALEGEKRRRSATERLRGLLSNPASQVPAAIRAPGAMAAEEQEMMGLLSEINPQGFSQGLLNSMFAQQSPQTSAKFADFVALGGNPQDMAAFEQFSNPRDGSQELSDLLTSIQIQQAQEEQRLKQEQAEIDTRTKATGRSRSVEKIEKIAQLMESVEGTAVEPGIIAEGLGDLNALGAAIGRMAGIDATDANRRATQFNTLDKEMKQLVQAILPDTFTNRVFEFIQQQQMGVGQQLGTNAEIMKTTLQQILDDDFNSDGDYDLDRDQIQALMARFDAMSSRALGALPSNISGTPADSIPPGFEVRQ